MSLISTEQLFLDRPSETVVQGRSAKKVFLKISQNPQENTWVGVSFLIKLRACNFMKIETLAQVLPYEFCDVFKSNFFHIPSVATSGL